MAVSFSSGVSIENGVRLVQPPALITISSQPTNNTVNYGANATFGVTASITRGAVLTYQWQYNHYGQGSWSDISGANTSTYTVNSVTTSANNDAYRVVLTGTLSANSVTSNTARLYVTPAVITINTQPSSNSVNEGQTASFSVSASVTLNATLSYQWQRNDGSFWTNVSGATSNTYTTGSLTNADDNNDVYRVFVSADKGATGVYSSNATLTVTSSVIQNSIDVVSNNGAYGAGDGTQSYINSGTAFGTVTSNLISSFAFINGSDVGPKTVIELKDGIGVYPGYDVLNGAIGMDSAGSRRTFTIGGTNAVFQYDGFDAYFKNGSDPFGLQAAVGTNVTVLYDANQQSTYSGGYFEPDTITYNSTTYYGANRDITDSVLPVFGFLNLDSDYVLRIIYDGTNTKVKLNPGSFNYGSPMKSLVVESTGAVQGDSNGSTRYFKVDGTNQTLTFNSSTGYYTASGDVFSLYSNLGQSISAIYDSADQPSQGGGGGGGSVGEITLVSGGWGGGGGQSQLFLIVPNTETDAISALTALQSGQQMTIKQGSSTTLVTMSSAFMVFAAGPSNTGFQAPTTESNNYYAQGFDQLTSVLIGTGSATYVVNTDFSSGGPPNYGPPGASIGGQSGGPYNLTIFNDGWTNTTGRDAILAKTSGTTFTAIIGGTTLNGTMTSGWTNFGPGSYASVTLDGTPMGPTTSITI
jgi:hypothetical protein